MNCVTAKAVESSNCLRSCQRTVSGLLLDADHLRQGSQREPILFKLSSASSVLRSYSLATFPYISVCDIKTNYQGFSKSLQEGTWQWCDSGLPSFNETYCKAPVILWTTFIFTRIIKLGFDQILLVDPSMCLAPWSLVLNWPSLLELKPCQIDI